MLVARAKQGRKDCGTKRRGVVEGDPVVPWMECSCWREEGASSPGVAEKNREGGGDRAEGGGDRAAWAPRGKKNWRFGSSLVLSHWGQNTVPCAGWARVLLVSHGSSLFVSLIE